MITILPCINPYILASLNREVQEHHAALFPDRFKPFNLDEFERFFETFVAHEGFHGLVAYQQERPVGYVVAFIRINPETPFKYQDKTLYIDQFGVNQSHRRTGVGRLLMDEVYKVALYNNIKRIELDHWIANTAAEQFFTRIGFKAFYEKMYLEL